MELREQFYEALRAEFENGQRASFLYRYLEKERREHPREDDYARLERCYALMKSGGAGQRDYLVLALEVLIKNSRLRPYKGRVILLDYGRARFGPEFFQGRRRDREKYRALLAALKGEDTVKPMKPAEVRTLHQELRAAILCRDAQTYLYDAKRKRDRDMAMLEAYCDKRKLVLAPGGGPGAGQGPLTPRELEQWETLFQALRRKGKQYSKVLIPIRIDPRTGAGLYIVGRSHYPFPKRLKYACYYACFCLDEVGAEGDITLVHRTLLEELDAMCDLPGLEEAEKWYFNMIREGEDAWGVYHTHNGSAPRDCPEPLRKYFQDDSDDSVPDKDCSDLESGGRAVYEQETENEPIKRGAWKK